MADLNTQQVLKVVIEGAVTSFRYPHFIQGVQPSYDMPPPATLFGHVCSTLGQWVEPDSFEIAYHFTYQSRFVDYEHLHLFGQEAKLSPFERELLFRPRLILYLNRPDWLAAFQQPRFVVTLGRSQDLMHYTEVTTVQLQVADQAYIEHSLLPLGFPVQNYMAVSLPTYINAQREVTWKVYQQVKRRQTVNTPPVWIDPSSEVWQGLHRALVWLRFDDA